MAVTGSQAHNQEKFLRLPSGLIGNFGSTFFQKKCLPSHGTAFSRTIAKAVVFNYGRIINIEAVTVRSCGRSLSPVVSGLAR